MPQYTLHMLTPLLLDGIPKNIAIALKKDVQVSGDLQPDHTYSFDTATAHNGYFSVVLYSLSIFKVILLMKKLWSSKFNEISKFNDNFNNFKTYLFHNTSDNYPKCTATTAMATEASIKNDKERLVNIASSFGFSILPMTGDGNCFFF